MRWARGAGIGACVGIMVMGGRSLCWARGVGLGYVCFCMLQVINNKPKMCPVIQVGIFMLLGKIFTDSGCHLLDSCLYILYNKP